MEKMSKVKKMGEVEKRIAGIVRWLERCLKACKTGALESALMDAECARADIELLRGEVWKKLEKQHVVKARGRGFLGLPWLPAKAAFLAMVAVLAAATPVALVESMPQGERAVGQNALSSHSLTLEWVTSDEKALLSNLRKHPSDGDSFASTVSVQQSVQQTEDKAEPRPIKVNEATRKTPSLEPEVREALEVPETQRVPYDRILSLVQTGEKAMKQQASIITIERQP
jgi:hypothetical protein